MKLAWRKLVALFLIGGCAVFLLLDLTQGKLEFCIAIQPYGRIVQIEGLDVVSEGLNEVPLGRLSLRNDGVYSCCVTVQSQRASEATLLVSEGGFKTGFGAILNEVECTDGALWLIERGVKGQVNVHIPTGNQSILLCETTNWVDREDGRITVNGNEVKYGVPVYLEEASVQITGGWWQADLKTADGYCIEILAHRGETIDFGFDPARFSASINIDGSSTSSRPGQFPGARESVIHLQRPDGRSLRLDLQRLAEKSAGWGLTVNIRAY